ncbi:MmgE/PrpD family protein [Mycobacterium sp. NPDC003449]
MTSSKMVSGEDVSVERYRNFTEQIADYIVSERQVRSTEPDRQAAFKCVLDLVCSAWAGVDERGPSAARAVVQGTLGGGDAPIWFADAASSPVGAAWANSASACALDLDDGHRLARGHPGAAVIPTALAVASETTADIEDVITAIVIGYEVGVTIGAARTSYGNTGTWSAYATVATAAALRRSPANVIAHALAIAGESSPNQLFASAPAPRIPTPEGSALKEGIPWSVVTGLMALHLAQAGHTGPRNILDSTRHYTFPAALALGSAHHIANTYFKLYACCRHVHAPLDAFSALVERHDIDPTTIDAIEVATTSGALRISNRTAPRNLIDVQYSIPYCLGLAAVVGPQSLLPLTAASLNNEAAIELAGKVTLVCDPEFDRRFPARTFARVTVACDDRRYVSDDTEPRGDVSKPLSWLDLEEKFTRATRFLAAPAEQRQVLDYAREMKNGNSDALRQLTTVLSKRVAIQA